MAVRKGIGDLLVQNSLIDLNQLDKARQEQKNSGARLTSTLVKLGYLTDAALSGFLGRQYNVATVDLANFEIDPEAIKLVSKAVCLKHCLIPVSRVERSLVVAFSDPTNIYIKDDLSLLTRRKIEIVVATEGQINQAIETYYGAVNSSKLANIISEIEESEDAFVSTSSESEMVDNEGTEADGPIIKFVNAMLSEAIKMKASDIHIEPYEKRFRIRYRVDGVLSERTQPPPGTSGAIVSRVKILCKMNIAERRRPQDGRLKVQLKSGREVDFRVSSVPTMFGEKLVLRLLDKTNLQVDLSKLGFEEHELKIFNEAIHRPQGMVLVTGPTGSGKTTTIYSALADLNNSATNVSSAEDPVEYNLDGLNQVQINNDIGFTFSDALRAFLRQDPEVIMVGEIRDAETAEIAYKAASTGHLVISTLHTNDAASTVTRLVEMGVPGYIVAEATSLVVAQRLMKTVCPRCKAAHSVPAETLTELGVADSDLGNFNQLMKGEGCAFCSMTGLAGRVAIFEIMTINAAIKDAIFESPSPLALKRVAMQNGMLSLRQNALIKLRQGLTTVEQVLGTSIKDDL